MRDALRVERVFWFLGSAGEKYVGVEKVIVSNKYSDY